MIDPISVIAGVVTTVILPKALEKVGEKIGETAWDKSAEAIQSVRETVQAKLQTTGTAGLLTRAEVNPTEANTQVLQAEIVTHMQEDQDFATKLQELVQQMQSESPTVQVILEELRVRGKLEIGHVKQVNEGQSKAQQTFGKNWQVGGDVKVGDVTQENRSV
ncbi:Fis family transcriptional regulator [Nostoc sp. LEGE 12450]|uniref:Fis family transcriptional regulator n=1 Tax=Nostoc sp. LEGE 12450 TaxID=1828643 RepID=UPI0018805864|nr:Fis family transcriptional regulator [Nostoc sp. LEGE 12450]MBE8990210.1 Fis family transcriptional regulator [Nostoc sp. LEGE 12450]